ncbi:unnamed protein product, partial [Rotaria sp. Silwood1]
TYVLKNKKPSTQVSNYSSNHRLLLVDRTNYQLPSSLALATSNNQYPGKNSVNETCVFVDSSDASCSTSSFTTHINRK